MSKRIIFTFDDDSLKKLEQLKERLSYNSLAEVIRDSLNVFDVVSAKYNKGYTEISMRNDDTDREISIIIDALKRLD